MQIDDPQQPSDTIRIGRSNWWTQLPDALVFSSDVSVGAIRCYAFLQGEAARDSDTVGCTHTDIAAATGMSERSIGRPLKWLTDEGWISRQVVRAGLVTIRTDYVVHIDEPRADIARPWRADERGVDRASERAVPSLQISLEGVKKNSVTRADTARQTADEFDAWWKLVPRRVSKGAARRAFAAARKKTDVETLTAGVRRWATETTGADPKFVPHPATWLNGERWDDQPTPTPTPVPEVFADLESGEITL